MSMVKRQLNELKKMRDYVGANGNLLPEDECAELEKFIDEQVRQCELYVKLEDLVKAKAAAAEVKPVKEVKKAKKAKPAPEPEIDIDDLLG